MHIQSVCDAKEVPHIDIRYDPVHTSTSINLYPDASALGTAYYDIIQAYGWKSFTILFESGEFENLAPSFYFSTITFSF